MFFSRFARIVAILGLVLGAGQVLMGLSFIFEWGGLTGDKMGEYTTAATTGEIIDRGIYLILGALALGTLAEIGLMNRKNNQAR